MCISCRQTLLNWWNLKTHIFFPDEVVTPIYSSAAQIYYTKTKMQALFLPYLEMYFIYFICLCCNKCPTFSESWAKQLFNPLLGRTYQLRDADVDDTTRKLHVARSNAKRSSVWAKSAFSSLVTHPSSHPSIHQHQMAGERHTYWPTLKQQLFPPPAFVTTWKFCAEMPSSALHTSVIIISGVTFSKLIVSAPS